MSFHSNISCVGLLVSALLFSASPALRVITFAFAMPIFALRTTSFGVRLVIRYTYQESLSRSACLFAPTPLKETFLTGMYQALPPALPVRRPLPRVGAANLVSLVDATYLGVPCGSPTLRCPRFCHELAPPSTRRCHTRYCHHRRGLTMGNPLSRIEEVMCHLRVLHGRGWVTRENFATEGWYHALCCCVLLPRINQLPTPRYTLSHTY